VNLTGFFWLTQRAIAEMVRRYGGHVVNISATLAEVANSSTPSVLAALTKGRRGCGHPVDGRRVRLPRLVRVNAVSPGIIRDPGAPRRKAPTPRRPASPAPAGVGQVSDVVDGILFLESRTYITGEILHIDGGQIAGRLGPTALPVRARPSTSSRFPGRPPGVPAADLARGGPYEVGRGSVAGEASQLAFTPDGGRDSASSAPVVRQDRRAGDPGRVIANVRSGQSARPGRSGESRDRQLTELLRHLIAEAA